MGPLRNKTRGRQQTEAITLPAPRRRRRGTKQVSLNPKTPMASSLNREATRLRTRASRASRSVKANFLRRSERGTGCRCRCCRCRKSLQNYSNLQIPVTMDAVYPMRGAVVPVVRVFLSVFCSRRKNSFDVPGTLDINALIRSLNTILILPLTSSS